MPILMLFMTLSFSAYSAEVATFVESSTASELQLMFTDPAMNELLDKTYQMHHCKVRFSQSGTTLQGQIAFRENFLPRVCKGEIIKFILGAGYKNIDYNVYSK